ncbi:MAG: DUF6703 family protein [Nocardioidaceae bacterium]
MSPDQPPSFGPRSAELLTRLHALPRLTIPVAALVLLLVGLFAPATYAVSTLVLLTLFVAWLATLSWPTLDRSGRLIRMIAVGALVGLLLSRTAEWVT